MKKKIAIIICVFVVIAITALSIYGEKVMGTLLTSTLKSQYGIVLQNDDIDFSFRPGGVSFQTARVFDAGRTVVDSFLSAKSIDIGLSFLKAIRGDIQLNAIHTDEMSVEVRRTDSGELELAQITKRFVPKTGNKIITAASAPTPSSKAEKPFTLPNIVLKSTQFNYYTESQKQIPDHSFIVEELTFNSSDDRLNVLNAQLIRQGYDSSPIAIGQLEINNIADESKDLTVSAETIKFIGKETEPGQYDFNRLREIWKRIFLDIEAVVAQNGTTDTSKRKISSLTLQNVTVGIDPVKGNEKSPGAIRVQADKISITDHLNQAEMSGIKLEEAGQPAITLNKLAIKGLLSKNKTPESVEVDGLTVDVRENAKQQINLQRAVQRIMNVIESIIPQEKRTASVPQSQLEDLKNLLLSKIQIAYQTNAGINHRIDLDRFRYNGETRKGELTNLIVSSDSREKAPFVTIPNAAVTVSPGELINGLELFSIKNVQIDTRNEGSGWDIIRPVSDWVTLSDRLMEEFSSTSSKRQTKPFTIKELSLIDAKLNLSDTINTFRIPLKADPLNLRWLDLTLGSDTPMMGALNIEAKLTQPCSIVLTYAGKAAPSANPVNLDGDVSFGIENICVFQPYYADMTPLGFDQSGLVLAGHVNVNDNLLDSSFDLTLIDPTFNASKGKWPVKIDGITAVTALNGMKNKAGNIAFPGNKLTGNITDPEFDLGIGIRSLLWKNLTNGVTSLVKLPGAAAGVGVDMVKKGVGSVGNAAESVGGALGDAVNSIFGGKKKKP